MGMLKADESGIYGSQALENGRVIDVFALTFGRARIGISRSDDPMLYEWAW